MSTSTIPAGLLRNLTPIEIKVTDGISKGITAQSLADSIGITLDELAHAWGSAQAKCEQWVKTDLSAATLAIQYKLDSNGKPVMRSRAERIALFQADIENAEAQGCRGNSITAEQLDGMLFPTVAPNTDVN
jgi:hypothetical protein